MVMAAQGPVEYATRLLEALPEFDARSFILSRDTPGSDKFRYVQSQHMGTQVFVNKSRKESWPTPIGVINPDGFYLSLTFLMLAMLVMGGIGSLSGAVVGVLVVSIAVEGLVRLEKGVTLGATEIALPAGSQEILIGLAMIFVLIFRPAGLLAGRDLSLPAAWVAGRANTTK
jgi:hypothetical protein